VRVNARRQSVELIEGEYIVARGTRRVAWRVRDQGGWVPASRIEGALTDRRSPGPGTVWERAIVVELSEGTPLERVERQPRPGVRADPFEYLSREVRSAEQRERRTAFVVGPRGALLRKP
jgi:hypothetical protein